MTNLPRLLIPAGILHIPAGFLLERFQLKERRSFCEGTLKKGQTDREGTSQNSFSFLKERAFASFNSLTAIRVLAGT
jgi:hypothetical protein